MAYGNMAGLVIVDVVQNLCLLNMGTADLYGSAGKNTINYSLVVYPVLRLVVMHFDGSNKTIHNS